MGNDVHYLIIFTSIFFFLGLIAPLLNSEFNLTYEENEFNEPEKDDYGATSVLSVILNIFVLPFWTFGFPWWVNTWILLPMRIPFWFVIARNIWVGGGG